MIVSTKGRYALRVMIDLAEHRSGEFISLKEIAQRQEISEKYLESIVKALVKDGILTLDGFDTALAEGVMLLTPFNADAEDQQTKDFVAKYQEKYNEIPNQFAADAYDCVYAYYQALTNAKATPDMDATTLCDLMIQQFTTMTFNGLTGDGAGITRGLAQAAASGVKVAQVISERLG